MNYLSRILRQRCVYWPPTDAEFDKFGRPLAHNPREIRCRWEPTNEQVVDATGTTRSVSVKVLVDEDLAVGGFLKAGSLIGIGSKTPQEAGALEIKSFQRTPDARAKRFLQIAFI